MQKKDTARVADIILQKFEMYDLLYLSKIVDHRVMTMHLQYLTTNEECNEDLLLLTQKLNLLTVITTYRT